jgi:hypothetical protein
MGELMNVYRVLVWKETHGRPSGGWETILKLILRNLRSSIKNILNWQRDWILWLKIISGGGVL